MGLFNNTRTAAKRKKTLTKKTAVKRQNVYGEYNARIRVNHNTGESELISIRKAQKKSSKST